MNDDTLPHSLSMRITDVGTETGDNLYTVTGETTVPPLQRNLTSATVVEPDGSGTYEAVFTEPVWYAIQFTIDNRTPVDEAGHVVFNPAPEGETTGRTLTGHVGSTHRSPGMFTDLHPLSDAGRRTCAIFFYDIFLTRVFGLLCLSESPFFSLVSGRDDEQTPGNRECNFVPRIGRSGAPVYRPSATRIP